MVQVPAETIVTVAPETVQTPDVAEVNATVNVEVEVAEREAGLVPKVISSRSVKVMFCVALVKVKVAAALVAASYVASAALVDWIRHVPTVVAVIVAVAVESDSEHPDAVPPDAIAKVVAPEPEPPEVVIDKACE
jgi:hypothetical protein